MLGLGSVFSIPAVHAESVSNIQSQRTGVQSQITDAENILKDLQAQQTKLTNQVQKIKDAINENNRKIISTTSQIKATEADVEALKKDIAVLKERIAQRQEVLKKRALSFQQSGGNVDVIEVLLGSASISDFISRVGAVAMIVEADQEILAQQETDKAELVNKKATVEEKLNSLKNMKVELEGMQAQIEEQKQQNENKMSELAVKEKQTANLKVSLVHQDANLAVQIASIQAENKQAAQRQLAQEKTLQEAATTVQKTTKQNTTATTNSSTNNRISQTTVSAPSSSAHVGSAITAGYKYIGNSTYVWGGGRTASDVANGYFDCSGFVSWAYSQAGVSLPASTDGLKNAGTQVSASQMQPGDLVFFNTYKTDGHVGIYIGNGKFIGSQSSTGVAIASFTSGYWAGVFNGRVVRIN